MNRVCLLLFIGILLSALAESREREERIRYDKIYDVDLQPPFPVKANTLVKLTVSLIEHRHLYPGEAFYLNYDNIYVLRYEPLMNDTSYLAEYIHFKPRRQYHTNQTVCFEIEFLSIDHTINLEVSVQRRDHNYPKVTPIYATQMNIYPHQEQLRITSNVSGPIAVNTVFSIKCEWKDYTSKIFFDAKDFKIIKLEDLEVLIRAVLKAEKVGQQIVLCRSNIDENNDVTVESTLSFNISRKIVHINETGLYSNLMYVLIDWTKLIVAIFILAVIGIVMAMEIFRICNIDDPRDVFIFANDNKS